MMITHSYPHSRWRILTFYSTEISDDSWRCHAIVDRNWTALVCLQIYKYAQAAFLISPKYLFFCTLILGFSLNVETQNVWADIRPFSFDKSAGTGTHKIFSGVYRLKNGLGEDEVPTLGHHDLEIHLGVSANAVRISKLELEWVVILKLQPFHLWAE
jgi:hypothetical protein